MAWVVVLGVLVGGLAALAMYRQVRAHVDMRRSVRQLESNHAEFVTKANAIIDSLEAATAPDASMIVQLTSSETQLPLDAREGHDRLSAISAWWVRDSSDDYAKAITRLNTTHRRVFYLFPEIDRPLEPVNWTIIGFGTANFGRAEDIHFATCRAWIPVSTRSRAAAGWVADDQPEWLKASAFDPVPNLLLRPIH